MVRSEPLQLDFEKMNGLVPAIIQHHLTGEVLMFGYMNRDAWDTTLRTGLVTFWSRTRKALWTKGETSGNRARVISAATDCDRDTVLLRVQLEGAGVICHQGTRSCFNESLPVARQAENKQVAR